MQPIVSPVVFCLALFIVMLVLIEFGRRNADRRRAGGFEDDKSGLTTVEGAVFALFGLLIAFTFSGAASRYNEKRSLMIEEVNAIETAYMRLDLLAMDARLRAKALMRAYTDSRIETYRLLPDLTAADKEFEHSKRLREEIWAAAVDGTHAAGAHPDAGKVLLPAIGSMIDAMNTRTMALQMHPPGVIYYLLFGLGALCALLAGFRMSGTKHRSWMHIIVFAAISVSVVYVTLDIEYPRWGLIRFDDADRVLVELRHSMH